MPGIGCFDRGDKEDGYRWYGVMRDRSVCLNYGNVVDDPLTPVPTDSVGHAPR